MTALVNDRFCHALAWDGRVGNAYRVLRIPEELPEIQQWGSLAEHVRPGKRATRLETEMWFCKERDGR